MSSPQPDSSSSPAGGRIALIVIAVFGLALIGAFVLGGRGGDDATSGSTESAGVEEVAAVAVQGPSLIQLPDNATPGDPSSDPAVGQIAPTLTGTDFAGNTVEIRPDGAPKVVLFLAHWCPHCQRELPAAVDLIEADGIPEGLEVYAVSTAYDPSSGAAVPSDWFVAERWGQPVLRDSEGREAFAAYGGAGFPFAVYLDGDNKVLFRTAGEVGTETMASLWLATAQR